MLPGQRIVCQCGGRFGRPIPRRCPHCGAAITSVRRRRWSLILQSTFAAFLFALLAVFAWWMASRG